MQPNYIVGQRVEGPGQIQVDSDRIYWLDSTRGDCRVTSAALDGKDVRRLATLETAIPQDVTGDDLVKGPGCGGARSIALADGYLYWTDPSTSTGPGSGIGRVSIRPPYTVEPAYIRLPESDVPFSLVIAGPWMYWANDGNYTVGRARLDGTDVQRALFQPYPYESPSLLGVAQGYLWWTTRTGAAENGSVGRARLDGSQVEPDYLTGIQVYGGVLSPPWLYYTGSTPPGCPTCVTVDGAVRRIALEPDASPELLAQLEPGAGSSIAVDSLGIQFPVLGIRKHPDGTATARVSTPRPADVSVRGRRIVPATAKHPRDRQDG